ncbi:uncharacterized protein LOC131229839 [Magnolia sinica]|uniref:uncharacterized protein LOC131229839 n=1 Tax=Magnolia sinica TaxID=86752 RepID=UPI002659394C|nr:uncharacterized protein LOC131229839 [Magnolia sinica]
MAAQPPSTTATITRGCSSLIVNNSYHQIEGDHGGTFNSSSLGLDASPHQHHSNTPSDANMGFAECTFSAARAAVLSTIVVNLLDILKVDVSSFRGNHERDWPGTGSFYGNMDSGGECGVLAETIFYVPAENRAKFWRAHHGVKLSGSISSQYLTALLMAAPLALGDVEIEIVDKLISVPYVEMTLKLMECFGVTVEHSGSWDQFLVKGSQQYKSPGNAYVEGDASSASYFLAGAAVTGGTVTVEGCGTSSLQHQTGCSCFS